jgi:hypothetical protein
MGEQRPKNKGFLKLLILLAVVGICIGDIGDTEFDTNVLLTGDEKKISFANGSNTITFRASTDLVTDLNFIWPSADATAAGQALLSDSSGVMSWGTPTTSVEHNFLSGTHDATTSAVTAGDIAFGNSTPQWDDLAIGSTNEILRVLDGLPDWQATTFISELGSVTISELGSVTIDTTLVIESGVIRDTTGSIDFRNENLSTTGMVTAGDVDVIDDVTVADDLTVADIGTISIVKSDSLRVLDGEGETYYMRIAAAGAPAFDADKSIIFALANANRTITLSGNPTLADWFDQSVKTTSSPVFDQVVIEDAAKTLIDVQPDNDLSIENLTNGADILLSTTNAGVIANESITGNSFVTASDIGIAADTDLLQLTANILTVNGSIGVGTSIFRIGDTDTLISFLDDKITLQAGNLEMLTAIESVKGQDEVVINEAGLGGTDVDLRVEGFGSANLLQTDGANDRIGIKNATPAVELDVIGTTRLGDSSTNYLSADGTGDTQWAGSGGLVFGHMMASSTLVPITVNVIAEAKDAGGDGWFVGELNVVTFPGGGTEHYLVTGVTGKFEVSWDMSIKTTIASGGQIHAGVMLDSTAIRDYGEAQRTIGAANDTGSLSGHTIVDVTSTAGTADEISLWLLNTSNNNDVTIGHGNIVIKQIGGT